MERQMTEAITVTNEELAILCDIVAGWSMKRSENLDAGKRLALYRLIANGFIEQAIGYAVTNYRQTCQNRAPFHPNSASE